MTKKIGIIGGLSPESTAEYYLYITRNYTIRYGDLAYPKIVIDSINLQNIHDWRSAGRWDRIAEELAASAKNLQAAGADFGLIATNTLHKVFDDVQKASPLPLVHILTPTIQAIQKEGLHKVGLLGTTFTMQETFYRDRLRAAGLEPIVPELKDQQTVHNIIEEELVRGHVLDDSRLKYLAIAEALHRRGAEGIILGCTEIPLIIQQKDFSFPVFDTTALHAEAALQMALQVTAA